MFNKFGNAKDFQIETNQNEFENTAKGLLNDNQINLQGDLGNTLGGNLHKNKQLQPITLAR